MGKEKECLHVFNNEALRDEGTLLRIGLRLSPLPELSLLSLRNRSRQGVFHLAGQS